MKSLFKIALLCIAVPLFVHTANGQSTPMTDVQKEKWLQDNPTKYQNQGGQLNSTNQFTVAAEDLLKKPNSISPSQILPNGDIINPSTTLSIREHVLFPNDPTIPVYYRTGDQQMDDKNYAKSKKAWIQNNPEKYELMNSSGTTITNKERLKLELQPQN